MLLEATLDNEALLHVNSQKVTLITLMTMTVLVLLLTPNAM